MSNYSTTSVHIGLLEYRNQKIKLMIMDKNIQMRYFMPLQFIW